MNGDGYDDLFISAVGEDDNAGVVFWFTGSAAGLGGAAEGWIKQSTIGGTNEVDDSFGLSLALGNLVGDSRLDLVVGAPNKTVGGQLEAGQVTVITGGASGPVTGTVYNYNNASGDLGAAVVPNSHFGYAVAVGRFQPGTYASLAVGEPDRVYFGISQAGRVGVGLGARPVSTGQATSSTFSRNPRPAGRFRKEIASACAWLPGGSRPSGSYDEVVVGVIMDDLGTGTSQLGQICGFYGGAAGPGNNGWFGFNQGTCNSSVGTTILRTLARLRLLRRQRQGSAGGRRPRGDANGTGAVHIIAPGVSANLHRNTAVITDCEGRGSSPSARSIGSASRARPRR
ncbi:MAG: hypothetical protein IPK72_17915 [Candidatus Eisenbacteria bacterium]|nr:hypothetical protein [Candidatus Eisenbacteria bacterium]